VNSAEETPYFAQNISSKFFNLKSATVGIQPISCHKIHHVVTLSLQLAFQSLWHYLNLPQRDSHLFVEADVTQDKYPPMQPLPEVAFVS